MAASNRRSWPLVGRDDEVGASIAALDEQRSVIIAGPAGAGKTHLARHLAERYRDDQIVRIAATSGISVTLDALGAHPSRADGAPPLAFVDDAHLLDDDAATLMHRLVTQRALTVVATVRSPEPCPAPLTSLWKDDHAERIDLDWLDRPSVDDLLDRVLDGVIEARTRRTLWESTQGSPLMLRELVRSSLHDESLTVVDGLWRLTRPPTSVRLDELIGARLVGLDDDVRSVVELVATGEPVGFAPLVDRLGLDALAAAERTGLVDVVTNGLRREVRLGHPMFGDVIIRRLGEAEVAQRSGELLGMLEATPMQRRDDLLQSVAWQLRVGGRVMSHDMVLAARRAMYHHDEQLAIDLATRALGDDAIEASLVLGDLLYERGEHARAHELLRELAPPASDAHVALVALQRAGVLFWGIGDVEASLEVLRQAETALPAGAWRDEVAAQYSVILVNNGRVSEGLELAAPLLAADVDDRPRVTAGIAASLALALVGRTADASSVATTAFEQCEQLGPQTATFVDSGVFIVTQAIALTEAGELRESEQLSRVMYDHVVQAGEQHGQGWLAISLGRACLCRGLVTEAQRCFSEASGVFGVFHHHGPQRWALAGAVISAAQRGQPAEAEDFWNRLGAVPAHPARLMQGEVDRAQAWMEVSRGERDTAIDTLEASARRSAEGGLVALASSALHDIARLGGRVDPSRWTEIGPSDGLLLSARKSFSLAAAEGSVPGLSDAAAQFEAIEADLFAAEAHLLAASAAERCGQQRAAAGSRQAAARAQRRLGEEWLTTLDLLGADATRALARLTDREFDIARRACDGSTSRMIAAELGVSPRTIDNHLQRCYAKLGISGRRELPAALAHLTSA